MADQKITDLTALAAPALTDLLAVVDDPSGTPATKKATIAAVLALGPTVLFQTGTDAGNIANTSEQSLHSYAMPGSTLAVDGDTLDLEAYLLTDANSSNKRIKVLFGATEIMDSGSLVLPSYGFRIRARITRINGTSQKASVWWDANNAAGNGPIGTYTFTSPGETLSGSVTIAVRGQSPSAGAADAVVAKFTGIVKHPVP